MATLLTAVRGIGPAAAKNLANYGITSAEELASVSVARLCQVPGYSTVLSQRIIADAKALVARDGRASAGPGDDSDDARLTVGGPDRGPDTDGGNEKSAGKAMSRNSKKDKKSGKKQHKTENQGDRVSKKNARKAKKLKKEIKSRKSKISRQDKKIKGLKKALKKLS
ncbi:MAG: helix-hairpin-helix domain-containing protein [Halieaceae bacterium]|jgi:hypothetical protein|nr:helix-hairpin-helix domain-containing protein [Halieaceae bacterium]